MVKRICQIFLTVIVFGAVLMTAACGAGDTGKDIQPLASIEIQAAPENEIKAAPSATPVPTPTNLPTELIEPVSPLQSVSPLKEATTMAPASGQVEPLPGSEKALTAATADLAERTGLAASEVRLVSMEAVDWNDTSLGCPQEGYMYAQVITPGFRMILSVQGQQYEYHTDLAGNVVLCES